MTLIHRFWIGPQHQDYRWITLTVQRAHPDAEVVDWTIETLPSDLLKLIVIGDDPVHISNIVRYWMLYEFGGLWLDHDVVPLRDLTKEQKPWTASLDTQREGSSMWFPKVKHPMMKELISVGINSPINLRAPIRSGGRFLREIGNKYPDVGYEERVLPLDSIGQRTKKSEIWAVHLWQTTS